MFNIINKDPNNFFMKYDNVWTTTSTGTMLTNPDKTRGTGNTVYD